MNKEFYYLDGKDQKGPLSIEKLNDIGIKPDTLVWSDDMETWKLAKEVSELVEIIKKMPPPPPIIDNDQKEIFIKGRELEKIIVDDSNIKLWSILKIISTIILLIFILGFIGYSYVDNKKEISKKEILQKINAVFDSKSVILDGEKTLVQGEIRNMDYKGKSNKDPNDMSRLFEEWWETEGLYTVFSCSSGGFVIKKLTRLNDESFDLEIYYSGDMGFTSPPVSRDVTSYLYDEYGTHNKYGMVTKYRREAQYSYNDAFNFFTVEDKTGAYSPGKLTSIENFPSLENDYFYFENCAPKQYYPSSHNSSEWWMQDDHSAYISMDDEKIFYTRKGKHYELTLNNNKYKKDLLIVIGSIYSVFFLLLIFICLSKPKLFRNLHLFGKRWKSTSNGNHILFFDHSFFTSNKFTELINENVIKGVLKITDKGNTINLSYANKELFYKIEIINEDNLKLTSLKDGYSISFVRIGAKINSEAIVVENSNQEETKNEDGNK